MWPVYVEPAPEPPRPCTPQTVDRHLGLWCHCPLIECCHNEDTDEGDRWRVTPGVLGCGSRVHTHSGSPVSGWTQPWEPGDESWRDDPRPWAVRRVADAVLRDLAPRLGLAVDHGYSLPSLAFWGDPGDDIAPENPGTLGNAPERASATWADEHAELSPATTQQDFFADPLVLAKEVGISRMTVPPQVAGGRGRERNHPFPAIW
jgi:hypothetical protein